MKDNSSVPYYLMHIFRYQPPDQQPRSSPTYSHSNRYRADSDSSRSNSPVNDSLEFITNIGDDDSDTEQPTNQLTNLPPHLRLGASSTAATWYCPFYIIS